MYHERPDNSIKNKGGPLDGEEKNITEKYSDFLRSCLKIKNVFTIEKKIEIRGRTLFIYGVSIRQISCFYKTNINDFFLKNKDLFPS